MIIFHHSLFFTFLTLAPVMCAVFLFSFYKLRLLLQRTQHAGVREIYRACPLRAVQCSRGSNAPKVWSVCVSI